MIITRFPRWFAVSSLCLLYSVATPISSGAASQPDAKPVAVFAIASFDALVEDIDFAGSLFSRPKLATSFMPMIRGFITGIDQTKPLGVIVQADGFDFTIAVCIPVTDFASVLTTLETLQLKTQDVGDGVTMIEVPQQPVFIMEKDGWAIAAPTKDMLYQVPDNSEEMIHEISREYDLGIKLNRQNVPEPYRQMQMDDLESAFQRMRKQQGDIPPELAEILFELLKEILQSNHELTVGFLLDQVHQHASLDVIYTAVEGSRLSDRIELNKDVETDIAGFCQSDTAASMIFNARFAEEDITGMEQILGTVHTLVEAYQEGNTQETVEKAKAPLQKSIDKFFDAFQSSLKSGTIEGGMVLDHAAPSLTLVAGFRVTDAQKIRRWLKQLGHANEEQQGSSGIQWSVSTHEDVSFHTQSFQIPAHNEQVQRLLGETLDIAVGVGENSVFLAVGKECLEMTKSVIDTSRSNSKKDVPPMELTLSLQQMIEMAVVFADAEDKPLLDRIGNSLANESKGRDRIHVVAEIIPRGVRTRIEVEQGVLRAIGLAAKERTHE